MMKGNPNMTAKSLVGLLLELIKVVGANFIACCGRVPVKK